MAPKITAEFQKGEAETPTETQQGLFQRGVDAIKTHSQVAFLALGIGVGASVIPVQQVQAQELLFPVVETSLSEETLAGLCAGNRGELDTDTLVTCFAYDISQYPETDVTLFAQTWNRLTDDQKNSVYGFFAAGMNSQEALEEVTSKNVPLGLHEAIIREATANGADSDFDLPAFEEELIKLQQTGNIDTPTLAGLREFSPENTRQLPIVISLERLVDAQGRLVDAQGRLVDAQGRLVDAQGRLVDAQGRLVDAQEARDALQSAADALKAAADAASGS